jgi:tetraacyldisaccharide 4'-kinase
LTLQAHLIVDPQAYRTLVSGQVRGFWPGMQRCGLWTCSFPYRWGMGLRNRLYELGWKQTVRAAVPVVSVGNLTLGGTGKTPCVEYVARYYRERDLQVAILSRGYGRAGGVSPPSNDSARNDEALVLEQNLPDVPHLQGADRAALAQLAVAELESEVLILDDGFQHRRLARDLDIVLLDATEPWGYNHHFPRGLLREGPASLRRADAIILTRCDQVADDARERLRCEAQQHAPQATLVESVHRPLAWIDADGREVPLETLRDRPVSAFCGLGNPDAFRRSLTALGLAPLEFRTFPDHHAYTRADVQDLHAWARKQPDAAVVATTQKDLVKLRLTQLGGKELWALRIGLHLEAGRETFDAQLEQVVGATAR